MSSLRYVSGDSNAPGTRIFIPVAQRAEPPPPAPTPVPPPAQTQQQQFEQRVIALVNQQRAANGLPALAYNAQVGAAARAHSQDMASHDFMSHTGSNGSNVGTRLTAAGYRWTAWAENVAAGQPTPDEVVADWMGSSGHRANILSTRAREVGAGFVAMNGTQWLNYWTLDFAAP